MQQKFIKRCLCARHWSRNWGYSIEKRQQQQQKIRLSVMELLLLQWVTWTLWFPDCPQMSDLYSCFHPYLSSMKSEVQSYHFAYAELNVTSPWLSPESYVSPTKRRAFFLELFSEDSEGEYMSKRDNFSKDHILTLILIVKTFCYDI